MVQDACHWPMDRRPNPCETHAPTIPLQGERWVSASMEPPAFAVFVERQGIGRVERAGGRDREGAGTVRNTLGVVRYTGGQGPPSDAG
jgi:hypothetical protein